MLAEESDPIFYVFGAEVFPRCPQCGLLMHIEGRRPSVVLEDAYETQHFACECNSKRCAMRIMEAKHRARFDLMARTTSSVEHPCHTDSV